ncbi:Rv2175c family DNA-binding protein [Nocardioides sp. TF02-7]|uniref:Rv2175c family DNA-binding protein n=1 Tax=Nocardioides sp. TF02-7 TaxID=2917724 RepID=UPI001F063E4B|nr:Rv2175c family DNA-binding protein [Nocardioides sp. TF02-7]UMG92085.1 Rv2175c family DNA-binding protein [Nocardioides sp. TF02-7]
MTDPAPRLADRDLGALVEDWLDWDAAGARLGVTPAKVRTMVRDHQLAAAVPGEGRPPMVPALFIDDEGLPVKGLPGLLTLLHDSGFDDRECIAWIFLDADLPGRPIDALRENRGTEVKRRAQALAF